MAPYIDMNTKLRAKATSDFEKDFFKLTNNAVFGKTIENLRKGIKVELVSSSQEDRLRRLVADPVCISHKIFSEDLVAVHSTKSKLQLNRSVYVGQAVLDLSKHLMYDFWYNVIKVKYGEKAQLLYTYTDSLMMLIETPDAYADMWANKHHYDLSDYTKENQYHDDKKHEGHRQIQGRV